MPLPASGTLSVKEIATELKESLPASLHALGLKAGFTPPINVKDFYGYSYAPGPPTNPSAVQQFPTLAVRAFWINPTTGGTVTNYRVERSVNGGTFAFFKDAGLGNSLFDNSTILVNRYQYRIRSEGPGSPSAYVLTNTVTVVSP